MKLPDGVEARFQVVDTDEFGDTFTMHLYGTGRHGWFQALRRMSGHNADTEPQQLAKGEWRTFLNFIHQSRFWELPEQWPDPRPSDETVTGGSFLDIAGRDRERYHRIHRFVWREPVLDQVLWFCRRRSGLFIQDPVSGFWRPNIHSQEPVEPDESIS